MNKSGFSLLEVIVASLVLAVGIVSVLRAFSFSAKAAGLADNYEKAIFLSQDNLQKFEFMEAKGNIKSLARVGQGKSDKFNWKYALNQLPRQQLDKLDFSVSWKDRGDKGLVISTYLRE